MQIFIRTTGGKMFTVDVKSEMTIAELKKTIEANHKIPIAELDLIFKGNKLKDTQTIGGAGISEEDTINIVKAPEEGKGDEIDLLIKSADKPGAIMKFKMSDTTKEIIAKVSEKFDMNPNGMRIYYKGQRLEPDWTIKDAGLKDKDTLLFTAMFQGGSL